MRGDDWFTLAELTERLGGLVWVEEQLSQLLTGWAANEASAPAAIFFATAGGHHAWHAQVVRGCLPTSPRLTEHEVVVAPTIGWTRTITTLATLTDAEATLPRLKALVKVIDPWLDREIGALLDLARPISDAAMMRWLRFITIDHHDDGQAAALLTASTASNTTYVDDHRLIAGLEL
ncbi:hypothetical protein N9812_02005 [bacterium]|nr:hypothetical protein [bacterium]